MRQNSNMETNCCANHRTAENSSYSQTDMASVLPSIAQHNLLQDKLKTSELDECPSEQVQSKSLFQFAFRAGARCVMQGLPRLLEPCEYLCRGRGRRSYRILGSPGSAGRTKAKLRGVDPLSALQTSFCLGCCSCFGAAHRHRAITGRDTGAAHGYGAAQGDGRLLPSSADKKY